MSSYVQLIGYISHPGTSNPIFHTTYIVHLLYAMHYAKLFYIKTFNEHNVLIRWEPSSPQMRKLEQRTVKYFSLCHTAER